MVIKNTRPLLLLLLLPFALLLLPESGNAQVLFTENFNGAISWNLNGDGNSMVAASPPPNGASSNVWVQNNAGPSTIDGTVNLHISCAGGACDNTAPVQANGTKFNATAAANATNRVAFMTSNFPAGAFSGTNLKLEFKWICNNTNPTNSPGMRMVYSVDNGTSWKDFNQTFSGASTVQTASILINSTNFIGFNSAAPQLRIGFRWFNDAPAVAPRPAVDLGLVVDNLVIRNDITSSLSLDGINPASVCQGSQATISYTATGFGAGITFAAELSNAVGSFAAPVSLGNLGASPFAVTIPANTTPGPGYKIRIKSSDGIISNISGLTVKKLPNPFITGLPSVCSGNPTNLTANPTTNAASYKWFLNTNPVVPGNTVGISTNLAGTYTVTVDSLGCSKTSNGYIVTNQPSPNASISGPANVVVCKSGTNPIPTVLKANTGSGLNYQWFKGATPIFPNGTLDSLVIIAAGNYSVQVTAAASGCATTSTVVTATESQVPPVPNAGLDSAVCSEDIVSAGFIPGAAYAGLAYNWLPTTGVLDFFTLGPSPNSPYVKITLTNTGNVPVTHVYTLFAIDPVTGCTSSDKVTIIANPNPQNVTGGEDRQVCENGTPIALVGLPVSTLITASPQGTGEWTGAGISVSGTQTLFTPATSLVGPNPLRYTYYLDWKNGGKRCQNFKDKTIQVNPAPQIQPGDPKTFCNGIDSVLLDGFTPTFPTGKWNGPSISPKGMFYPAALPVGSYVCTLTSTNAHGCTGFGTRTLTITSASAIEAGPLSQSLCSNLKAYQMTGFSPPTGNNGKWTSRTINISSGGALTFDSTKAGIHILRYTFEKDGCKSVDSVFMTIINAPKARVGRNDSICANDSCKTLLGASPSGGKWKGIGVDPSGARFCPSNSPLGPVPLMYKISENGCADSTIRIMFVKSAPVVNAGQNDTICASVDSLRLSGFSPSIGKWYGPGMDSIRGVFRPKKFNLVGNITVRYKVKSANGCTAVDEKQITVYPLPAAIAGLDTASCTGERLKIGGGRIPNLVYTWFEPLPNSIDNDTIPDPFLTIINSKSKPDTFFVRLKVEDTITRCINRDTARVIVYPRPNAVAIFPGTKTQCFGDTFIIRAKTRKGLTYEWLRNGLSLNIPSERDTILRTPLSGKYELVVRNKGASCSDTSLSDSLSIFSRFIPRIAGTPRFCKDSTTRLRVLPQNEGFTYEWQYNGKNVPDSTFTTFTIGKTGTVRVILRTDKGCRDSSATVSIDSLPVPTTGFLNDTVICENQKAIFKAPVDSLYQYRWIDSATRAVISTNDTFYTSIAGKYYLEVYNFCKVAKDSVVLLRVNPLPRFGILNNGRKDTIVCVDLPVKLFGPVGYQSYTWSSDTVQGGTGRLFNLPTKDTIDFPLALKVTDEFGCSNSDTIHVVVQNCPPVIYIPNAFSPQGDKINDLWRIQGYAIDEIKIYVFNRWGQMVFYADKIDTPWDGNFNGTACPSGAYKYLIEYKGALDNQDMVKKETGSLTIIR